MFQREKKAVFPFILFGLFDPEGLGAGAGLHIKAQVPAPRSRIPGMEVNIPIKNNNSL
ncbi:hypothetical protein ACQCVP_05245 [Rossellomorea vietnamensis]|uniref:hypothetical protein n=1 Tax=Rossellomorea vietnamensis TaxID=218284 RepID=UPI003CF9AD6C